MFHLFGSSSCLLITEVDTWSGFYAAMAALQPPYAGKFKKVICAVKNKHKDWLKQVEKLGGEVRDYDPFNPASFEHILSGVDAVLLVAIHTEHTVECTRNFIETAQKIDSVKYLLFWSYLGVSFAHQTIMGSGNEEYLDIFRKYAEIESILKESKFENECVIRNGFFVQLFFAFSQVMQNKGIFPLTSSSGKMAPVSAKDVSTAAVTLLHDPKLFHKYNKQTLTLTGARSYNGPSLTQCLNRTLNTRIEFQEFTLDEMKQVLEGHTDADPFDVRIAMGYFQLLRDGKLDVVSNDIEKLLSRTPTDVEDFFQENQDAFRPVGSLEKCYLKELRLN